MPGKGRQIYFSCREERDNKGPRFFKDSLEDMVEMVPTKINQPMSQQGPSPEEAGIFFQLSPRKILRLNAPDLDVLGCGQGEDGGNKGL